VLQKTGSETKAYLQNVIMQFSDLGGHRLFLFSVTLLYSRPQILQLLRPSTIEAECTKTQLSSSPARQDPIDAVNHIGAVLVEKQQLVPENAKCDKFCPVRCS
jgi:hypothetical protein